MKHGHDVLVIDSLVNSSKSNLFKIKKIVEKDLKNESIGNIIFCEGDLRDKKWVEGIFEKQIYFNKPIESVIHFAGLKSVEESVLDPLKYWDVNIAATLSLLSSMIRFNCNTIVFSSSATIYRPKECEKLFENSLQEPINPYGNTKIAIEKILKDLYSSNKNKWKIISLRYFNPVGAHDSGLIGEEPTGKATNLFPILEKVVIGELDKLFIFGNDWPTKDGTCIRDYIHIMDLAQAHYASLKFLRNNEPQFIALNIGNGKGLSVLEIIKNYARINDINLPFEFADRRKGDAPFVVADNSLALELLDWKPEKSLEDICKDSFRYTRNKLSNN